MASRFGCPAGCPARNVGSNPNLDEKPCVGLSRNDGKRSQPSRFVPLLMRWAVVLASVPAINTNQSSVPIVVVMHMPVSPIADWMGNVIGRPRRVVRGR